MGSGWSMKRVACLRNKGQVGTAETLGGLGLLGQIVKFLKCCYPVDNITNAEEKDKEMSVFGGKILGVAGRTK